jgi:hypothetical protein
MVKIALLIGVSEYGFGFNLLPGAIRDVEAMQQVLQAEDIGNFDEVKRLLNPNPPVMREAITQLFSGRNPSDVILLFFAGHLVQDDNRQLYFTTSITCKTPRTELIRVSTVAVSFVQELMQNSSCQNQVVILDCSFNTLSPRGMRPHSDQMADIKTQLSAKKQAILVSCNSSATSLELENFEPSTYTRYLVEGMKTGAADLDCDGWILADELHEYASHQIKIAAPSIKLELYWGEDGYHPILLSKAVLDESKLKYRQECENWIENGVISDVGYSVLGQLAANLHLTFEDCITLETEVLKPYQEYQHKLQRYEQELKKTTQKNQPLGIETRDQLRNLQQFLALRDEDIIPIEERIAIELSDTSQSQEQLDEQTQPDLENQSNAEASVSNIAIVPVDDVTQSTQQLVYSPTESEKDNDVNKLPEIISKQKAASAIPSAIPQPVQKTALSTSTKPPLKSNSTLKQSSGRADLSLSSHSNSTLPNKLLFSLAIGGGLATLAMAIGISARNSEAPSSESVTSSQSDNQEAKTDLVQTSNQKKPVPSPPASPSPENKVCSIFVNGNLRSEPAAFRNNVVEALREPVAVTGKQTQDGWIQVRLPSTRIAWAHPNVISNKAEMDECLRKQGITVRKIEPILPP